MFSDALRILDENTVKYMIEELRAEVMKLGSTLEEKDRVIEERDNRIKRLEREIAELRKSSISN